MRTRSAALVLTLSLLGLPWQQAEANRLVRKGKASMTMRVQRAVFMDGRVKISHRNGKFLIKRGRLGATRALKANGKTSFQLRGLHVELESNRDAGVAKLKIPKLKLSARLWHDAELGWQVSVRHGNEGRPISRFKRVRSLPQWIPFLGRFSWFPTNPAKRIVRISPLVDSRSERRGLLSEMDADAARMYAESPTNNHRYSFNGIVVTDTAVTEDGQSRRVQVERPLYAGETRVLTLKSRWLQQVPLFLPFLQGRYNVGVDFYSEHGASQVAAPYGSGTRRRATRASPAAPAPPPTSPSGSSSAD